MPPTPKLLPGYSKADTNNLPYVDIFMLYQFFNESSLLQPEASHDKTQRSTQPNYGDKAIGFVQVKREGDLVNIQALMRPQTRIRNEDYVITAIVRDRDTTQPRTILKVTCNKCASSSAMCKHVIAFVAWLNRRSDEESPTSIECYWKKSSLADIGSGIPFIKAKELVEGERKTTKTITASPDFLDNVILKCSELNLKDCLIFNQFQPQIHSLSMHYLMFNFIESCKTTKTFNKFIRYLKTCLSNTDLDNIAVETEDQSTCILWKELRYGRITASKLHEMSKCKTPDGSLVKMVLGAKKIKDNKFMKRGRELEIPVLKIVEKKLKLKINRTGLVLNSSYPLFGSSPDGINATYVFEVKCPGNNETFKNYMDEMTLKPKEKYEMQIQLQMLMSDRQEGYFCVARPDFEASKRVEILKVSRNEAKLSIVMHEASKFWENFIYPKLYASVNI